MALLKVENLCVDIPTAAGILHAVRNVSFDIAAGETVCIVGESGCGKSLTSLALMGLLPHKAKITAARMSFEEHDLIAMPIRERSRLSGRRMSMIFQEPMTSLNPALTIGEQLCEVHERHITKGRDEARKRAIFLLDRVGISGAASRLLQYPHELSGGLRQRVMIAMALMCNPSFLVADEPTTALDVTIQAQVLRLLADLRKEFGLTLLLITHDLGLVSRIADRVLVMYGGQVVEAGTARRILTQSSHPYTRGLLDCLPTPIAVRGGQRLGTIPGRVPTLIGTLDGCSFRNRCSYTMPVCAQGEIDERSDSSGHAYRCLLEPGHLTRSRCA
ncbi:ABC transporter ATP-binding protein [Pseudorhodoplanes sp.]|uniref:ABC transporter ATP-binding protein n=1 Tax=Pseudorhodoplanes sp. TaxID=1934341 RepID=UPI003D0B813A